MRRLIDADAMIKRLEEWNTSDSVDKALYNFTLNRILEQPTIEPEQKRGEWRHYEGYLICSKCRTEYDDDIMVHCCDDVPKFCPNCGAYMRKEEMSK